jgi:hypothetical protein
VIRMKIGVTRKEATDRDGSVGATCEFEVEIPSSASDEDVLRIRDHWLGLCEATVEEELDRLRSGASDPPPRQAPVPRSQPERASAQRYADRPERSTRDRRDEFHDDRHIDDNGRAPSNGRQLLGWAAKQDPDAKGLVISFGKRKGYPTKIVDWDDEQVRAAYRYANGQPDRR